MCSTLRVQGLAAINEALKPLGLVATFPSSMSFGPGGINTKLHVMPFATGEDPSEALAAQAKREYEFNTIFLGLPADSFGKGIVYGGKVYKIAGLVGGRSSKVAIARQPDGKIFHMKVEAVITALASARALSL
jgi:hypothetical protein